MGTDCDFSQRGDSTMTSRSGATPTQLTLHPDSGLCIVYVRWSRSDRETIQRRPRIYGCVRSQARSLRLCRCVLYSLSYGQRRGRKRGSATHVGWLDYIRDRTQLGGRRLRFTGERKKHNTRPPVRKIGRRPAKCVVTNPDRRQSWNRRSIRMISICLTYLQPF